MRILKNIILTIVILMSLYSCAGSDITQKVKTYFIRQRTYEVGFIIGETSGVASITYDGNDVLDVKITEGDLSGYSINIDNNGTEIGYGEYKSNNTASGLSIFSYVHDIFNSLSHNAYKVDTKEKSTLDNRPCYYEDIGTDFGNIRLCIDSESYRPIKIQAAIDNVNIELNIFGR